MAQTVAVEELSSKEEQETVVEPAVCSFSKEEPEDQQVVPEVFLIYSEELEDLEEQEEQ
jgi:hypothetical protein